MKYYKTIQGIKGLGFLQYKQEIVTVIEFLLRGVSTFPSTIELRSRLENDKVVLQTS
jgi:hypothetical protein